MTTPASPLSGHLMPWLAQLLRGLCEAVAARGGRDHSMIPLVNLAWTRISRTMQRFQRLVARLAAGRPAPVRRPGGTRVCVAPAADAFRLPRDFGWLVRLIRDTSAFTGQLQAVLTDPEMAALLDAEPGARRILRPLCRMLGLDPGLVGCRSGASPRKLAPQKLAVARPAKVKPPAPVRQPWAAPADPGPAAATPVRPARWVVFRRSD